MPDGIETNPLASAETTLQDLSFLPPKVAEAIPAGLRSRITTKVLLLSPEDKRTIPVFNASIYTNGEPFYMPLFDCWAPSKWLKDTYPREVLEAMSKQLSSGRFSNCGNENCPEKACGIRSANLFKVTLNDDGNDTFRRYGPFSMDTIMNGDARACLCSKCKSAGFLPCASCNKVCKLHTNSKYCETCYVVHAEEERRNRDNFTEIDRTNFNWKSEGKNVLFGVELEFSRVCGQRQLTKFLGDEKHFPLHSQNIETKDDGSLEEGFETIVGPGTAIEIATDVANICKVFQFFPHNGENAGLHIHASFAIRDNDERVELYKRVASLWSAIEPLGLAIVPPWRRNNSYAKPLFGSYVPLNCIDNDNTDFNGENDDSDDWRYRALNTYANNCHGTLEWRLFPATSDYQRLSGYLDLVEWIMLEVWEKRKLTDGEWIAKTESLETVHSYLQEAFKQWDAPNYRFLQRAMSKLGLPVTIQDFCIENIGYNIVQAMKHKKETNRESIFTAKKDKSSPSYSYKVGRNTSVVKALKEAFPPLKADVAPAAAPAIPIPAALWDELSSRTIVRTLDDAMRVVEAPF